MNAMQQNQLIYIQCRLLSHTCTLLKHNSRKATK